MGARTDVVAVGERIVAGIVTRHRAVLDIHEDVGPNPPYET